MRGGPCTRSASTVWMPPRDIRDLRSLLAGFRLAKQTAVQTAVRLITTGILLALMAGIAIKLKLFGASS